MRAMLAPPEPRLHVLLAETEGRVVGFVSYMVRFSAWAVSEFISIDDLFVLEHARGLGAGRALMHQVGRVALARGLSVRWEVEAANEQALAFYRGLGASMAEKVMCRWEPRQIREALSRAGGAAALPPA